MPKPVQPSLERQTDLERVDLVCDFSGCYETWDRPPPPRHRPRPLPPEYYPPSVYDEPPGYRPPRRSWERHVDWCLNRYRSYNPRTNQFLSSRGYYKVCQSPFY